MTSKAQIEANRKNAKLSKGPRTPEGKARSAQNSTKHGIFANEVLIRLGESREDGDTLEALHAGLMEQFRPVGELERELVSEVVANIWRRRRLHRYELATVEKETMTAVDQWERAVREDSPTFPSRRELSRRVAEWEALVTEVAAGTPLRPSRRLFGLIRDAVTQVDDPELDQALEALEAERVNNKKREDEDEDQEFRIMVHAVCRRDGKNEQQLWDEYVQQWEEARAAAIRQVEDRRVTEDLVRRLGEVPHETEVNKIVRYEGHLARQFARTLDQLQKLQAMRDQEASR